MTRDLVSGCILFAFSIVYYAAASAIPVSMLADSVGAQGLPKSYGIALGILSLLLILQSLYALHRRAKLAPSDPVTMADTRKTDLQKALRAGGMLVFGIVYVLLLPWLGYVICLALLIVTTIIYQERQYRHKYWLIAIIGAVLFWGIFVQLLQIAEPAGLWSSFL